MSVTTQGSASTSFVDPIDRGNIEALVQGRHGAPFDVLGQRMLHVNKQPLWNVRAWQPGAEQVWVVPDTLAPDIREASVLPESALPMRQLDPQGLFTLLDPRGSIQPYHLAVRRNGALSFLADPYAFQPLLSEYDLYLMGEGTHRDAYERLGAHLRQLEGVAGVGFAVWAPNARRVSVVGDFNGWDERANPMRMRPNGVWELFLPGVTTGALYKYAVLSWNQNYRVLKSDPFAFWAEIRPGTASRVWDLGGYQWNDEAWRSERDLRNRLDQPISIYEVHMGSWRPNSAPGNGQVTYRDLAQQLVPYVKELGYTHIELMPVAEYPFDGSWGYQVTGYYAPTSRYGTPQDFMYFVDMCHQQGIGVLVDWVPAHFPRDEHGLRFFDGTHLYEHADPRRGEHPEWGTVIPNFGRNEVRNFFISNALFWLDKYHVDGLRVDAVASLIYLDYGRKQGEWEPNAFGGRENLEAVSFIQECNSAIHERFPHALTVAEESTAWPNVTAAPSDGGLGFTLKWNMGWMHDILDYFKHDPIYRSHHQNEMTFSFTYTYSEKFVLPLSHDEVVHIKGSMLNKMPGDIWQRFANLRALYAFMYGHPGKKLLFMGGEFGQWSEWNFAGYLDWYVLDRQGPDGALHEQLRTLVRDLNHLYTSEPALHEGDADPSGFEWIDGTDAAHSTIFWLRFNHDKTDAIVVACNFTPVPHYGYRIGVPAPGKYVEILNTDAEIYGGGNVGNLGGVLATPEPMHHRSHSIVLTLPPLAVVFLRRVAGGANDAAAAAVLESTPALDQPLIPDTPVRKRATGRRRVATKDSQAPGSTV